MALTEEGESFIADARIAVERAILAEEKALARQAIKHHHLCVGHSTYLAPRLIALLHRLHIEDKPLVRIEHVSGLTSTMVRQVLEGSLHAGFGFLPIHEPELLVHLIYEEPIVACIPSGHSLATKPAIYPHDLDGEPIVAVSRELLPVLHREIEDHFAGFGIALRIVADAFSPFEAIACVKERVGICLLAPSSIAPQPGIVVKPLSSRVLMRRSGVFFREDNRSPLLRLLVDTVLLQVKTMQRRP